MNSKGIVAATASQTGTSTGLTLADALCLFTPLVIFLAVLGWTIWEMRLANPMAFEMFAGSMAAVLVLALMRLLTPLYGGLRKAPTIAAKQFDPFYEMIPLTSLTVAAIERKQSRLSENS